MKRFFIFIPTIFILFGCSTTKFGYFCSGLINPIPAHHIRLVEDYDHFYYSTIIGDKKNIDTILFFIPGTGNASIRYYLEAYFKGLKGNIMIAALQPRYISNSETGIVKPSAKYDQTNTFCTSVKDNTLFIKKFLASYDHSFERIVLFGVSYGGTVASVVSGKIPKNTHLVVLGEGGMKMIDAFTLWGSDYGIDFKKKYEEIKSEPDSIKKKFLGGNTYKWWASYLDVNPMDHLHDQDIPMLFCIGEKDEMVPIESIFYLRDKFQELGKNNLTIKIYPDCNHFLIDADGVCHRSEFMEYLSTWLSQTS